MRQPQAVIIAGPNGSGKSTAAAALLPADMTFVNADIIAQRLTGKPGAGGDIRAGRFLIAEVEKLEESHFDFAFETTLATQALVLRANRWRARGYAVHIIFFWLPSEELAVQRVAARVRAGGHFVPEETVRRRYRGGLKRLFRYFVPMADTWRIYDNSSPSGPMMIARYSPETGVSIKNEKLWTMIKSEFDSGE